MGIRLSSFPPEWQVREGQGAVSTHTIRVAGSEMLERSFSLLCTPWPEIPPSQLPHLLACSVRSPECGVECHGLGLEAWGCGEGEAGKIILWSRPQRGLVYYLWAIDSAGKRMRKHRDLEGWGQEEVGRVRRRLRPWDFCSQSLPSLAQSSSASH